MRLSFGDSQNDETLPGPENEPGPRESDVTPGNPDTPKRRGRPPGSKNRASSASLASLEERLRDKLLEDLLPPVALASPLAAANMEARAERTVKAAMRIAAKNPQVKRGIEKLVDGSDVFTLVLFPLTTLVCIGVDWGMIQPLAAPARASGVPRLWEEIYPDEPLYSSDGSATTNGYRKHKRGLLAEVG